MGSSCGAERRLNSPSALKADRRGAAISSSTDDSILRSPSITQGV